MVQTYQSPVRVYKYPFELVMAAYNKRFPTCHMIPVFVGSDIISDEQSADGAEHVVERKCKLNVDVPYILKKVAGIEYIYFMQKNSLDRRKRVLNIDAYNVTFSSRVIVNETCLYYVHPENPEWTCFEQTASLDVKSFFGFEATVEKIAMKQYSLNIQKGKEIIEYYIADLLESGITFVEPFKDPPQSPSTDSAISDTSLGTLLKLSSFDEECLRKVERKRSKTPKESAVDRRLSTDDSGASSTNEQNLTFNSSSSSSEATEGKGRPRSGTIVKQPLKFQLSDEKADVKLETEYIHRFLGDLSPLEESRLCELRYNLQQTHKGKVPNDAHMLRFLRARGFDVHRAREMLVTSMMWRKQHQVDKILSTYQPPAVLNQFFSGAWHNHDLNGRPILILRLGQMDIKGLLKSVGEEGLVKFVLSICEEGLRRCEEATLNFGKPISSWTLLVDVDGLSMRHLWRPGIKSLLKIIEVAEANYPETMGLALIVRAPRVFPVLWTLVSPLIDENTRNKFFIYGGNDYESAGGLCDYVALEYIPDFLGGKCACLAKEGGLVPKSLYTVSDEDVDIGCVAAGRERSPSDGDVLESLYLKGHVYKGLPHEVLIPINQRGSVITWDFDVAKGECEFLVLRTTKIINPDDVQVPSPNALSALPSGLGTINPAKPLNFDKSLELGTDLFIEDKPWHCREGDSVQGSRYCSHIGTYILQWRSVEPPVHNHSFDLSLHKCKVMFYYQVLNSDDFKGSMASIASCRSSFSSLSVGDLNQSSLNVSKTSPSPLPQPKQNISSEQTQSGFYLAPEETE